MVSISNRGGYIRKKCTEAFLDRSYLLAEQVHYVQKSWMNLKPSEETPKVFLTNTESAPRIALINETNSILDQIYHAPSMTNKNDVVCTDSITARTSSVVRTYSNATS